MPTVVSSFFFHWVLCCSKNSSLIDLVQLFKVVQFTYFGDIHLARMVNWHEPNADVGLEWWKATMIITHSEPWNERMNIRNGFTNDFTVNIICGWKCVCRVHMICCCYCEEIWVWRKRYAVRFPVLIGNEGRRRDRNRGRKKNHPARLRKMRANRAENFAVIAVIIKF